MVPPRYWRVMVVSEIGIDLDQRIGDRVSTTRAIGEGRNRRVRAVVGAVAASAALLASSLVGGTSAAATPVSAISIPSVSTAQIPAAGGIELQAYVAQPAGEGPHPLIVMPAPWGGDRDVYVGVATLWASKGYVAISYTSRGFNGSGGEIDIAGPLTVGDVSTVIDWAGANTSADLERIGGVGISYGAGNSLLAAADDPRIDAVVAFSGWVDMAAAFYQNQTLSRAALDALMSEVEDLGTPSQFLVDFRSSLTGLDPDPSAFASVAESRSAFERLDAYSDNGTAILLSHGWTDGLFDPTLQVEFFNQLDTDKKLVLSPGGHAAPEGTGALGLPNARWAEALAWVDHHVAGRDVDTGLAVTVVVSDTREVIHAETWAELSDRGYELSLHEPTGSWFAPATGDLTASTSGSWSTSVTGGYATAANSGAIQSFAHDWFGFPELAVPSWFDREGAAVWESDRLLWDETIVGHVSLDISVTSDTPDSTFFAYLYEQHPSGVASLITHKPYTVRNAAPGVAVDVSFELDTIAWEMELGSRLVLVLDTEDPRYGNANDSGSTVTFSSHSDAPATLRVPVR